MKFWDSSAIIPLCLKEKASEAMKGLMKDDEDIVVWWTTRIECLSALSRRQREGVLPLGDEAKARTVLSALAATWSEVQPTETVRLRAERLLSIHPLRAADALQLSSALIWAQETPRGLDFVCLDQNLRVGALKEGFSVLPPD
ncbi:MAG: type II toxin-antitoxin system VapC family toxin [Deltaproteobacteria bacterium]|nr:type II toxin-antitoxin system VapC family toxin [Deltaproteobacteria bacterium]